MEKQKEQRVLVLTYWAFQDALIQTYTLPYLKIMAENPTLAIWLVCLQPANKKITPEELEAIQKSLRPFRIQLLVFNYKPLSFVGLLNTVFLFARLFILTLKLRINVIHAWGTPAGALGYLIAKPLSRRLIIDSYEPHAEAMVENGTWNKNGLPFRLLFWLEKKQTHYATIVIAAAAGMRDYAANKYLKSFDHNFFVKPACVDIELFNYQKKDLDLRKSLELDNKIVGLYAGKFGGIYLDKEFFQWVKIAEKYWGNRFRLLLLTNLSNDEILNYCNEFGISPQTIIQKFVPHHEVARYMGITDFALTPVKPVPSKRYCTPIKDGEYWAMGLPVIITKDISDDSGIIENEGIGYVLKNFSDEEYSNSLVAIENILAKPLIGEKIVEIAKHYRSFKIARNVYRHIYSI